MDREQFNQNGMFSTVSAYMNQNNSLWNGVPALVVTVGDLDTNIANIADKGRKQQSPTSGMTLDKTNVRLSFEEKILEITDQLSALAAKNKDAMLGAQVEFTPSSLDKMEDDALETTGQSVSALATANLAALADYGIVAADVSDLDDLTASFHNAKTAPRTAIAERAGETGTLPTVISDARSLLRNRLDKQMTRFKKSQPEFFAGYRAARVIVDRGGSGGKSQPKPTPPPAP